MKVHVLHWQFDDKSNHGIVGIFQDEEQAKEQYDLLTEYSSDTRQYFLDTYTLKESK